MKKILISGANGQLAHEIQSFALLFKSNFKILPKTKDELDISNLKSLEKNFRDEPFDLFINTAAYTKVDEAEKDKEKAFLINKDAPSLIAKLCNKHKIPLIHISTDYVFDGKNKEPYKEDQPTNPIGVYGKSKEAGEQNIIENVKEHIIIRTSWLYGHQGKNFVKTMIRLFCEKDEVPVVNDQLGSPTYAYDLAEAILKIADEILNKNNKNWGIYHYSNSGIISWFDFAKSIFKKIKRSEHFKNTIRCKKLNKITTKDFECLAARPEFSAFDLTKIKKNFCVPIKNWEESLETMLSKEIETL